MISDRAGLRSTRSRLVSRHAWRLAGMTLFGGILGPALFFEGVFRVPAHLVAVLQHLEFLLTVIAATLVLRERPGWRGTVGIKGIGAGLVLLTVKGGSSWALSARNWVPVLLAGGIGVGASLVMELLALRRIGAALNAGLFATGPAFAFVWSLLALGEKAGPAGWAALVLCRVVVLSDCNIERGNSWNVRGVRRRGRHAGRGY